MKMRTSSTTSLHWVGSGAGYLRRAGPRLCKPIAAISTRPWRESKTRRISRGTEVLRHIAEISFAERMDLLAAGPRLTHCAAWEIASSILRCRGGVLLSLLLPKKGALIDRKKTMIEAPYVRFQFNSRVCHRV